MYASSPTVHARPLGTGDAFHGDPHAVAHAALAVVLALFILLNPNTAMNIVWGFMGVSIILEAGLEIATIILLK